MGGSMQWLKLRSHTTETQPASESAKKQPFFQRPVGAPMIIAIIIGVIIVRGWLMEGVIVRGESMEPTLRNNERLIVAKKHYSEKHPPARGDIVVFPDPADGGIVVKRVIGLPGETLTFLNRTIAIDGKPLSEPYAHAESPYMIDSLRELSLSTALRLQVPPDSIFVMGDNRDNSTDSRDFGPVKLDKVRGRAVLVLWPLPPRTAASLEKRTAK
jgi:signal peptidase I